MSTARGEDKTGGASPSGARASTGPSAAPPEGRLLTSEDLFGDLVDDVLPDAAASSMATRTQPIKVQVSEPGVGPKPSITAPTAAEQQLPADVATPEEPRYDPAGRFTGNRGSNGGAAGGSGAWEMTVGSGLA